MNQAREHDHSGDDAPIIEPALIEQTPLETALWDEATKPLLPGESAEDWFSVLEQIEPRKGWNSYQDRNQLGNGKDEGESNSAISASHARARWQPWQWRFLSALRRMGGVVSLAARAECISYSTLERYRANCKEFDSAIREVMHAADDRIEASLRVSATVGDPEPVFQGGVCVGFKRKKSDRAAEMLLRAKRPGEWRPDGGNQVAISLALPTGDAVAEAMARLTAPEVPAIECGTLQNATISDASA